MKELVLTLEEHRIWYIQIRFDKNGQVFSPEYRGQPCQTPS